MAEAKLLTPIHAINGAQFKYLLMGAVAMLERNYQKVNQLNVFPVPDGDTGTNMLMTVRNAWSFIASIDKPDPDFGTIAVQFARGAIRGSRGNSGTILSELLRGFASETSSYREVDLVILQKAFREAVKMAYSVVEKPVEGTILTVAREIAEEIESSAADTKDLIELLRRASHRAQLSVARTPDLLPILRKAGVVDSGGQGLAYLFEGMYRQAIGEMLEISGAPLDDPDAEPAPANLATTLTSDHPEGYGYDVQFLLLGDRLDVGTIRSAINNMGVSGVITGDDSAVKVHIHVHNPGIPLSYGVSLGAITDVVVENMQMQAETYIAGREQAASIAAEEPEAVTMQPDQIGVVVVAPGVGFQRIFRSMGAARVINGGQTMNPSSGEIADAVNALPTDRVIILPNNKNIVLTAEQASKECVGKQVKIVATRTVPQGIAAMLAFKADGVFDSIGTQMDDAKAGVTTCEITTASRTVTIDDVDVSEGQIIGLIDGKLAVAAASVAEATEALLDKALQPTHELVTLYYGAEVAQTDADALGARLAERFPAQEFDINNGGQPHYFYIVSIE